MNRAMNGSKSAYPTFAEHALHARANLGAHLVAMRLGPVHLQIALDRLDDVGDQVAE